MQVLAVPAVGKPIALAEAARPDLVGVRAARVRAMVLLAGAVRQSRFFASIERSPLDLPIAEGLTVLDFWHQQVQRLAESLGQPDLGCRLVLGSNGRLPLSRERSRITIETDPAELRGTGGLLRDLALDYEDEDRLIVATATQVPLEPVERFVHEALAGESDVSLLQDVHGTPPSLFMIACRALRKLPARGFVDLKEQALPLIARQYSVQVVSQTGLAGMPIRTAASYLAAIQAYGRCGQESDAPFRERWRSQFAIAEPGARVHPGARLHNAVVLSGADIDAGCTVANSVVCPGARIRNCQVVGQVVTADGSFSITDR